MASPVIVYPIFLKCKEYTLDSYWKDIFSKCACNRFPRGIRYDGRKNTVYIKLPGGAANKKEFFSLPKEPIEVFETMMAVFRSVGLRSQRDLQLKKDEMEKIRRERCVDLNCSWKDLKPRYLKDRMIIKYVLYLKDTHQLTQKEAKKLLNVIHLGFQLKQIGSDDVKYENGHIKDIEGLEVNKDGQVFRITKEIRRSYKSDKTSSTNPFLQVFENYLKEAKKQRLKL